MPFFKDSEELYDVLGNYFKSIIDTESAKVINQVGGPVQYVYSNPEGKVTMMPETNGGEEMNLILGDTDVQPLLTFKMNADVGHRFWLGKVDLSQALARQQMQAVGPLSKALKVVPALQPLYGMYKDYLVQINREDLIEA
ncbi:hypothetical protein [Aneurinibacillus tyrosinisolvens]|jgi:hypothetical protein|uniref:hypothetical protein n=1 Tax=Aneurinibacillus tyrosinisolvens TaxID=1443435 RepID=UPI00063EE645|nr:hypothetical protein [Aneurinibacillus tyrosinisolvens]